MPAPRDTFIGEPIEVDMSSLAAGPMSGGAPACPGAFVWRGREYQVARVLEHGRRMSPDGYVRQHRYRVETTDGCVMVIACDRQLRRGGNPWQLLTVQRS